MIARLKFSLLQILLKWFAEEELDQFEIWEYDTHHGKVWVQVTRKPLNGNTPAE